MDILLVTCEHAGNVIPAEHKKKFRKYTRLLRTHQGYDIGAAELFGEISSVIADRHYAYNLSRLLIDPNRSLKHRAIFSAISRALPADSKSAIVRSYYQPYRDKVETAVKKCGAENKRVIHVSVHTFTPVLNRRTRTADIGLLYDPRRRSEKKLCRAIRKTLRALLPELRIRMNYPYTGISDGLVSYLRRKFAASRYCGIELEVNQKFWTRALSRKDIVQQGVAQALRLSLRP